MYYETAYANSGTFGGMRGRRPKMPHKKFPNRLREWREARGLSIKELALKAGIARWQNVQRYETGERRLQVEDMPRFAAALDIAPGDLLTTPDSPQNPKERVIVELIRKLPLPDQDKLIRIAHSLAEPVAVYDADAHDTGPDLSGDGKGAKRNRA